MFFSLELRQKIKNFNPVFVNILKWFKLRQKGLHFDISLNPVRLPMITCGT